MKENILLKILIFILLNKYRLEIQAIKHPKTLIKNTRFNHPCKELG